MCSPRFYISQARNAGGIQVGLRRIALSKGLVPRYTMCTSVQVDVGCLRVTIVRDDIQRRNVSMLGGCMVGLVRRHDGTIHESGRLEGFWVRRARRHLRFGKRVELCDRLSWAQVNVIGCHVMGRKHLSEVFFLLPLLYRFRVRRWVRTAEQVLQLLRILVHQFLMFWCKSRHVHSLTMLLALRDEHAFFAVSRKRVLMCLQVRVISVFLAVSIRDVGFRYDAEKHLGFAKYVALRTLPLLVIVAAFLFHVLCNRFYNLILTRHRNILRQGMSVTVLSRLELLLQSLRRGTGLRFDPSEQHSVFVFALILIRHIQARRRRAWHTCE